MNPYDFAIQMSRDGEKFFRILKRQVKNPGLRRVLVMLSKDQALHRRDFAKLRKEEGRALGDAESLTGVLNPFARRLERLAAGEWLDENLPPAELHRRGRKLAKECEEFYLKRAYRVKDSSLQQAFLELAEVQRKHYVALERQLYREIPEETRWNDGIEA